MCRTSKATQGNPVWEKNKANQKPKTNNNKKNQIDTSSRAQFRGGVNWVLLFLDCEMAQQVKQLAAHTRLLQFDPWNPHKGREGAPKPKLFPELHLGILHPLNNNNKTNKQTNKNNKTKNPSVVSRSKSCKLFPFRKQKK